MLKNENGEIIKNTNIDNLEFKGAGLRCFLDEEVLEKAIQNDSENKLAEFNYMWNVYGKKCRENCMRPGIKCPDDCYCRWFA
jgi:hypothetical protein